MEAKYEKTGEGFAGGEEEDTKKVGQGSCGVPSKKGVSERYLLMSDEPGHKRSSPKHVYHIFFATKIDKTAISKLFFHTSKQHNIVYDFLKTFRATAFISPAIVRNQLWYDPLLSFKLPFMSFH